MKHYLDAAEKAARAAGELLRKNFHRSQHVNVAEAHDIKLAIDVETQELITKQLLKQFPEHALYGEEGIVGDQSSDHQWVVDPLDGTVNYFYRIPHFCVSIALRLKGEIIVGVIYDPMREEMWSTQKGEKPRLNGQQFPEHALYGEEGIVGDQSSDHQWVVDPLDGTVNYFYRIPHFCVSIALRLKGEIIVGVIYDPMREEMWSTQKGEKPRLNGQHFRVSD